MPPKRLSPKLEQQESKSLLNTVSLSFPILWRKDFNLHNNFMQYHSSGKKKEAKPQKPGLKSIKWLTQGHLPNIYQSLIFQSNFWPQVTLFLLTTAALSLFASFWLSSLLQSTYQHTYFKFPPGLYPKLWRRKKQDCLKWTEEVTDPCFPPFLSY